MYRRRGGIGSPGNGGACVRDGGGGHAAWRRRGEVGVDEGVVVGEVELVADEEEGEIRGGEGAGVVEEGLEVVKGRVGGDVVDEDGAGRAAVVGSGDGAEAFGSCSVPELGAVGSGGYDGGRQGGLPEVLSVSVVRRCRL